MRGRWITGSVLAVGLAALITLTGCSTDEAKDAARHAELIAAGDTTAAASLFHTEVAFFRRYAKAGWKPDRDRVFTIKDESQIKAEATLHNLRPERTYSVHVVWIRPDGEELFRRYAEITRYEVGLPSGVAPDSNGALPPSFLARLQERYGKKRAETIGERLARHPERPVAVTETVYKKAVDLGFAERSIALTKEPRATLESRLNISREKEREPGEYRLRIYLDRQLLQEVPFRVEDAS